MDAHASNLTQYGYDCVVAMTQGSINANMLEYFQNSKLPVVYVCWIWDENDSLKQVTIDELKQLAGGVNPFDIDPEAPISDPNVQRLKDAFFHSAYMFQPGLPPGMLPSDLSDMVILGNSASNVIFTMYFSQFTAIEYSEAHGHSPAKWKVWSQGPTTPWTIQTRVSLVTKDLETTLDTPYFQSHPTQQKKLLDQFQNITGSAFSLQQLLFDFENATIPDSLTFPSADPTTPLGLLLGDTFAKAYSNAITEHGEPLISIQAVATAPEASPLHITSIDRMVSPLVDGSGIPISNPSEEEQEATTLDYLCMVNKKPFKGSSSFAWNWIEPSNLGAVAGVMAVNRQTICERLLEQLLPAARSSCLVAAVDVTDPNKVVYSLAQFGEPQTVAINPAGRNIISIAFTSDSGPKQWSSGSQTNMLWMRPAYNAEVSVEGTTLTISQTATLSLTLKYHSSTEHGVQSVEVRTQAVDRTIVDAYDISVDMDGSLAAVYSHNVSNINNDGPPPGGAAQEFVGELWDQVKTAFAKTLDRIFTSLTFSSTQNFIFPGAKVFVYKDARFSDNQDLITSLTYQTVTGDQSLQPQPVQGQTPTTSQRTAMQATPATVKQLPYSTELVQNYLQAEVVSPERKFEALQTDQGHTLLFTIGTAGTFNVIEETSGMTSTGWVLTDLSSALRELLPGTTVRTFDVAQSVVDGTISIAVAMSSEQAGTSDVLVYLSSSNSDTSWIENPLWKQFAFDDVGESSSVSIAGILFSETADRRQYLMVDVDGSAVGAAKDIRRYYVDTNSTQKPHWKRLELPVNVQDVDYQSCIGRIPKGLVDGVYTSGSQAGSAQLVYVPMAHSKFAPPSTTKFHLPQGIAASAIAAARQETGNSTSDLYLSTDLYAVGSSSIFRFAAADQVGPSVDKAVAVVNSKIITGTIKLICEVHDGTTTLWGLTDSHLVYYVSCPTSQVADINAWSPVNPILTDVEQISAYVNRVDGGNTIFAAGGGKLRQMIQATSTKSKLWRAHEITLAAQPQQKSLAINSYTTTIQALDSDGAPVPNAKLLVSAKSRVPVYINGLYYILKPSPVTVSTDSAGLMNIIEKVDSIHGTILTVETEDGLTTTINPFDVSFKKLTNLNSKEKLMGATVPINLKAGGVLGPKEFKSLIKSGISKDTVDAVATNLGVAQGMYDNLQNPDAQTVAAQSDPVSLSLLDDFTNAVEMSAGDFVRSLKTVWNDDIMPAVKYIEDKFKKGWHMFVQVADNVYHAVIHAVEDAVAAVVEFVDKVIEKAQEMIDYLKVLFDWDDITRTKNVMHNITMKWLKRKVQDIGNFKTYLDDHIVDAEKELLKLTGVTDWSIPGEPMMSKLPSGGSGNPHKGQTSASSLLANHYRNHKASSKLLTDSSMSTLTIDPELEGFIEALADAAEREGEVVTDVVNKVQDLVKDFHRMTINDFLVKLVGVLGTAILGSVKVVADCVLDILVRLSTMIIDELDRKIHIPVLSDVLNELGISDFSTMDVFFYILATMFTIPYKIANGKAPFPDNDDTKKVTHADTWDELRVLFHGDPPDAKLSSTDMGTMELSDIDKLLLADLESELRSKLHPKLSSDFIVNLNQYGHIIVCVSGWASGATNMVDAEQEAGQGSKIPGTLSAIFGGISGVVGFATDYLIPKSPMQNIAAAVVNAIFSFVQLVSKLMFSGPGQMIIGKTRFKNMAYDEGAAAGPGAVLNAILDIPGRICSCVHLSELSKDPASNDRSAAIIEEVSNLTGFCSKMCVAGAINDPDPESKQAFIYGFGVCDVITGGLQLSLAFIN